MPLKAVDSEDKIRIENMKSNADAVLNHATELKAEGTQQPRPPMKSSGPIDSSQFFRKRTLPSQTGTNHHPYQLAHPGSTRLDLNIAAKDHLSSFTQRVMSAKLLRLKQLQNQLSEAHLQINELCTENRLLRSLQKRQDLALDRYEGTQAQLPQLVRSHQEEVRVLRTKYKNLKTQYRTVTNILKERETELQNLKEQHAHLLKLSRDRQLGDREALSKQVDELKLTVDSQASTIQVLNRKVLLEAKNLKFQLQQEMQRHKATQSELQRTLIKMDHIQGQLEQAKERNVLPPSMDRFGKASSLSKLAGVPKLIRRVDTDISSLQNPRDRRMTKGGRIQLSANNTDPSTGQPDSSPATNEFSTSLDSSTEHIAHEINANDRVLPTVKPSDSYQPQQDIMSKGGTALNFHHSRDEKVMEKSSQIGSQPLIVNTLEKEYEDAVAMLNELSTSHGGNIEQDISCSFASLDLISAKHVAALANATFAENGEMQSSFSAATSLNELSFTKKGNAQVLTKRDGGFSKTLPGFGKELAKVSRKPPVNLHEMKTETVEISGVSSECSGKVYDKSESITLKKPNDSNQSCTEAEEKLEKIIPEVDEPMALSHKEALLKALKAIDEKSNRGSDSDSSDSPILKISAGSVIPQRRFSGVGTGNSLGSTRRKNPFK